MKKLLLLINVLFGVILCWIVFLHTKPAKQEAFAFNDRATNTVFVEIPVAITNTFSWKNVESADYRAYIESLRRVGCPEQTIRDIIIADVDELFEQRRKTSNPERPPSLTYWTVDQPHSILASAQEWKQNMQTKEEKRLLVKELLGIDIIQHERGAEDGSFTKRLKTFLPPEKVPEAYRIADQFNTRIRMIQLERMGDGEQLTFEDRAAIRALEQEKIEQLANVLDSREMRLFELWMSPFSHEARKKLAGFQPTEAEFLAYYRLLKPVEEWSALVRDDDAAGRKQVDEAREQAMENVRAQWGEERVSEWIKTRDSVYLDAAAVASRFQLPADTADRVYELNAQVKQQRADVKSQRDLSPEQRREQNQIIAAYAQAEMRTILGETAFSNYVRRGIGSWLR